MVVAPLNLEVILVEYLAGSRLLFFFLALAIIVYFAAQLKMTGEISLFMVLIFIGFMATFFVETYKAVIGLFIVSLGIASYSIYLKYFK